MSTAADETHRVPRLDFELTSACDHGCGHCYNVWGAEGDEPQSGYPRGQLSAPAYVALMEKAVTQSGADHITITGGEPLLHKGALAIIDRACALVSSVHVITNGSHVTPAVAERFAEAGVRCVQLTLLSADRALHDRLKGSVCFDDTVRAAVELLAHRVPVAVCFVAMAENADEIEGVMELCFALGVRALTYNRMAPAGGGVRVIEALLPDAEQVERHLGIAERRGPEWGIRVSTAMPIPPCLVSISRYRNIRFGFCSTGSRSPNIVIDAQGNVRSCNLSSEILGNLVDQGWPEIHGAAYLRTFRGKVPEMCRGCHYERSCQGGCKESAFATYGSLTAVEPFVRKGIGLDLHAAGDRRAPGDGPVLPAGPADG